MGELAKSEPMMILSLEDMDVEVPERVFELRAELKNEWVQFADCVSFGQMSLRSAYTEVYGEPTSNSKSLPSRLASNPRVAALIKLQRRAVQSATVMDQLERRAWLSKLVRSNIKDVVDDEGNIDDFYGELVQKVKVKKRTDAEGGTEIEFEVVLPDKLKAIDMDAKLSGDSSSDSAASIIAMIINGAAALDNEKTVDGEIVEFTEVIE